MKVSRREFMKANAAAAAAIAAGLTIPSVTKSVTALGAPILWEKAT